jgi:hypothetical protein
MKKIMLVTVGMLATLAYGFDNSTYIPETGTVPRDSAGFDNVKTQVQTNFNEMYHALPADLGSARMGVFAWEEVVLL